MLVPVAGRRVQRRHLSGGRHRAHERGGASLAGDEADRDVLAVAVEHTCDGGANAAAAAENCSGGPSLKCGDEGSARRATKETGARTAAVCRTLYAARNPRTRRRAGTGMEAQRP